MPVESEIGTASKINLALSAGEDRNSVDIQALFENARFTKIRRPIERDRIFKAFPVLDHIDFESHRAVGATKSEIVRRNKGPNSARATADRLKDLERLPRCG